MDKIIKDYRKAVRGTVIRFWIVTAIVLAVFVLSGTFVKDKTRIAAVIMASFMTGLSLFTTLNMLVFAAAKFRKRLKEIPPSDREKISQQYEKAPTASGMCFLGAYLLFFGKAKIELFRYAVIEKAELCGFRLRLAKTDGSTVNIPISGSENPSAVLAILKSKNPNITFFVDGNEVDVKKKKGTSK